MLIESAFSVLPEAVSGWGFQKVRYEANAVSCFSFSLLNALHAKNVNDPIQRLQLEHGYDTKQLPLGNRRVCDIYLDYGGSRIGTKALANYGWRYRNFLEAKFFRYSPSNATTQSTNASNSTVDLLCDLLRLTCLTPEPNLASGQPNAATSSARYFLLLSDQEPHRFINQYLHDLHASFKAPPTYFSLDIDFSTPRLSKIAIKMGVGFGSLALRLHRVTCFSHYPIDPMAPDPVWMLLLRIDAFEVSMAGPGPTLAFRCQADRRLMESTPGAYSTIRTFVGTNLR